MPFTQILDPVGSVLESTLVALVPVVVLLVLLAGSWPCCRRSSSSTW
jgi:hypothetical protein